MTEKRARIWDRKKRKWFEDRIYVFFLVVFGCIFLTVTDGWKIYRDPLQSSGGKVLSVMHPENSVGNKGEDEELAGGENDRLEKEMHREAGGEEMDEQEDIPKDLLYQSVEDDYFEDAVFIGDSRIVGMYEYGGLEEISTFYASTGLSVHKLFTAEIVPVEGQRKKSTVEEALRQRQFAKVYLMLGINEMGTGTAESFLEKYAECVAHIRELQPDAIIYLQSIMKVTEERSVQGDYITNEGIDIRNEGIAAMADNASIFYLDVNPSVCDETGAMIADYTYDGVHLKAQYIALWKDFLKCHAVEPE